MTSEKTVLAADDNEDILALVAFRLERAGYRVLQARDGDEALRMVMDSRPDMVILDLMMPRLDGYEVTRRIRAADDEATRRMPVMLLTARAQEADVSRGFEAGADDYLRKPFSPQELLARVQAMLERR